SDDPASYEIEGPFGEFTGYVSDLPTPRPTMKVTCITHRCDPIFCGSLEGTLPGSYSENSVMSSVQRAGIAWNILNSAGIPGIFGSPIDPSTPMEDRDVAQLGTGLWNRMLIDATRSWKDPRRSQWGGERFPPTVRPSPEDEARVRVRWSEYGLGDL